MLDRLTDGVNLPTMIAAALLALAVIVVIKIGRVLLTAAIFGAMAGGVSLGQGNAGESAATHATIGFAVAAITLFLIKVVRGLLLWVVITALGVGMLALFGFRP